MKLVKAKDFASGYVQAALWHPAESFLRLTGNELIKVIDVRTFVDNLIVTNATFAFTAQVERLRFEVEERLQNATRRINVGGNQRLLQVMLIPNRILTVGVLRKTGC